MWKKNLLHKIYHFCCNFLVVQLFINLIAWPLFLGWGIPITPLSILGNIIFSPFLTAFLILSSLITICNLCFLPDFFILYLLELLTQFWLYLAQLPMPNCMITCIEPPFIVALCAPLGATYIMIHRYFSTDERKIIGLSTLYTVLMFLFSLQHVPESIAVPYGNNNVIITYHDKKLTMTDPGFTRRTSSIQQWINYTLLPIIGNTFGQQTIDTLIVQRKNPSAIACAQILRKQNIVTSVVLEDEHVKTTPSSHAVPLMYSKNPSSRNPPAPQHRVLPHAWRR